MAYILAQPDAPPRDPRPLAAELLALYFTIRHDDVRVAAHGEDSPGHEDEVLVRADSVRHANQLKQRLGPELSRVVGLRAIGRTLGEIGGGRAGLSTVHERQAEGIRRVQEHVRVLGLTHEDLEPVLATLAA